jgi:hypothetical protein
VCKIPKFNKKEKSRKKGKMMVPVFICNLLLAGPLINPEREAPSYRILNLSIHQRIKQLLSIAAAYIQHITFYQEFFTLQQYLVFESGRHDRKDPA